MPFPITGWRLSPTPGTGLETSPDGPRASERALPIERADQEWVSDVYADVVLSALPELKSMTDVIDRDFPGECEPVEMGGEVDVQRVEMLGFPVARWDGP